jgi:hypothetical protein
MLFQFPSVVSFEFSFENRLPKRSIVFGQKAEDSKNVTTQLNSNFIKGVRVFEML